MHKQFQKLFVPKSLNDEDERNDKYVKYLYKKENDPVQKQKNAKIKSANAADRYSNKPSSRPENKKKKRHKRSKSNESSVHRQKRKTSAPRNHIPTETEIFYISPEDIKKHKKTSHVRREKSSDYFPRKHSVDRKLSRDASMEKRTPKKDDFARLTRYQKLSGKDEDWLKKNDIFKLIKHIQDVPKSTSVNSNFLKKFFFFDKSDSYQDKVDVPHISEKRSKKMRPQSDDRHTSATRAKRHSVNTSSPPLQDTSSPYKIKTHKHHQETADEVDQIASNRKKRIRSIDRNSKFIFEEFKSLQEELEPAKKQKDRFSKRKDYEDKVIKHNEYEQDNIEPIQKKSKSKANPKRHRMCLVSQTFSVTEIPSTVNDATTVEKKKRLETFKKYYRYNRNDGESEITNASAPYSDCQKMYQDTAVDDDEKISNMNKETSLRKEPENLNETGKKSKTSRIQKSKIPVFHAMKPVELIKDSSPVRKSFQKSADLFHPSRNTKKSEDSTMVQENNSLPITGLFIEDLEQTTDDISNHHSISYNLSFQSKSKSAGAKRSTESKANEARTNAAEPKSGKLRKSPVVPPTGEKKNIDSKKKMSTYRSLSVDNRIESKELKDSRGSSASRQSRISNFDKRADQVSSVQNRKSFVDKNRNSLKSPSRLSYDGSSSLWSKNSRKSASFSVQSKSDTRIPKRGDSIQSRYRNDRFPTKTSLSNSTCDDRSLDSSRNTTSFLLTKVYKDDDKLSRWQKRKLYSDTVRRNAINKNKQSAVSPQVLEVRYLTVATENESSIETLSRNLSPVINSLEDNCSKDSANSQSIGTDELNTSNELFEKDLPISFKAVDESKFTALLDLPSDEALEKILSENYNFLKKDFSLSTSDVTKFSDSDDVSTEDVLSDLKITQWHNFQVVDNVSIGDISCLRNSYHQDTTSRNLSLGSQDQIIDSLSAPSSEESGYATVNRSKHKFFQRPDIKALLETPLEPYCVEFEKNSSSCGMEIHCIESKSLQTTIECSEKSVQIKLSSENKLESINFSERSLSTNNKEHEEIFVTVDSIVNAISSEPTSEKQTNLEENNNKSPPKNCEIVELFIHDGNSDKKVVLPVKEEASPMNETLEKTQKCKVGHIRRKNKVQNLLIKIKREMHFFWACIGELKTKE